ncbi:hypothetical protein VOLCADRAFT_104388 [Volvox carteri f. nagariensis]|uniref:Uncharacterized protein n=1 Tax=Volvox carteri f. nagariensis TaxID=3068 RepID=D8TTE3_VOLCA|nr:uncharacterized protein VOLCADRAFT_104388 [Volvox carteri f. nagariensis]EFJ49289.1 hypothetical protein VOLCADRAFT_104388 [Volvox carteri f. nagariensis]|eukprot:XP_002949737.1 hypothetical protein VOLCADRAFT_104388 [Volvox carteri f. nagariensis]
MKSGIDQLREEKYRFTIETQGLAYTTKHHRLPNQDEDADWSGGDSDQEVVPTKNDSPLAHHMATELIRVLREGESRGCTDDALERLLAGPLQSGSNIADYDVAKDYIKQGRVLSSIETSSSGSPPEPGPGQDPPLPNPMQTEEAQATVMALMAPPWTAAIRQGSTAGAGSTTTSTGRGADDDDVERPRPRPHHGRIKEQMDLLQNADQLAAIISVATTAATTAAAAAVKQTMLPPPGLLPPGAYARMHAAGRSMYGLPVELAGGARLPQSLLHQRPGTDSAAQAPAADCGNESPDPQPQERQGALVSPHRRFTPMVIARRAVVNARDAVAVQASAAYPDENEHRGGDGPGGWGGLGQASREAQMRRQRLRWSQRLGVPLGQSPVGAPELGGGTASPSDALSGNASGTPGSNLRVVRLGAPRVTARTPRPIRPESLEELQSHAPQDQVTTLASTGGIEAGQDRAGRAKPSRDEEGALAGGSGKGAVGGELSGRPTRVDAAVGSETQTIASLGSAMEAPPVLPAIAHAEQPDWLDSQPINGSNGIATSRQPSPARNGPSVVGDVHTNGYFVTGGESVFARAHTAVGLGALGPQAGGAEATSKAWELGPPQPRRSALPADVRDAFRSTLAFIGDPDGARAQQHKPPSWAALADVEERKEAQREAEELLGGAFDYAAVKRELEQARRASRLMVQAGGPASPSACLGAAAHTMPSMHAAGGRPRPVSGTVATTGLALAKAAPQPRGDFTGLLPPPYSVWDVDEAWFDLGEFTKAVEAEVAYRAAAPAAALSQRGSPGAKQAGSSAAITTAAVGQTARAGRTLTGRQAISTGTATAPGPDVVQEQTDATARTGARQRALSPGPRAPRPLLTAAAAETSSSPPRALRKTQASGSVRIAFGRRVDEAPKAVEAGSSRARSSSPPTARASPSRARTRTRKTSGRTAAAADAPPPSPNSSSTGDAMHQVLSALASVLLSDGDEADDDVRADQGDGKGVPVDRAGSLLPTPVDQAPGREAAVQTGLADPQPVSLHAIEPEHKGLLQQQPLVESSSTLLSEAPEQLATQPNGIQNIRGTVFATAAPSTLGAASSNTAAVAQQPWPQPGALAWPNTTATSRPRFQYVVDTAHPPITRLPAWAASAASAEGAPSAYMAALGAAPTGLGFSTPIKRQPPGPAAAAMALPLVAHQPAHVLGMSANPSETRVLQQTGGDGAIIAATKGPNGLSWQPLEQQQRQQQQQLSPQPQQQLTFPAPGDVPSNTRLLPPQAAGAALAAAAAAASAPATGRRAPDPGQQWEADMLQVVEDEVVKRLAMAQLSAQDHRAPEISLKDLSGMVPPLVDLDLSRRLVCDVLRDNLRSLLASPWQQSASAATETAGVPTLEEVVAALATMPVLPERQQQQEPASQHGADAPAAAAVSHLGMAADAPYNDTRDGERSAVHAAVTDVGDTGGDVSPVLGLDASFGDFVTGTQSATTAAIEGLSGSYLGRTTQPEGAGGMGGQDAASPGAAAAVGTTQAWQPVYAAKRAQQSSQTVQAAPNAVAAAVQTDGEDPGVRMLHADASTGMSAIDLAPATHSQATWQYSAPVSFPTSAIPAGLSSELMPSSLSNPLGFPGASLPSIPTPGAMGAGKAGLGGRDPLPGAPLAAPAPDQGFVKETSVSLASSGGAVQQSPSRSQGVQAHGVQARGVQAHGAEARAVQAHGVVEARGIQAHGMAARAIQAAGVQERATQAAGVMDRSSQADPPPPHYLLQAAMMAGLPNGTVPPLPRAYGTISVEGGQPILAPDGSPLAMPRPFYLVPADNSQLSSVLALHGGASEFTFPLLARGEGSRPLLNIPGLSKLRDSSDVESSTDSMERRLQAPAARARAAALEALRMASRGSLDSDDGILQRSYAQLELAALTARPVRLDQHRTSSEQPQRSHPAAAEQRSSSLEPTDRVGSAGMGINASGSTRSGSSARSDVSHAGVLNGGKIPMDSSLVSSGSWRRGNGPVSNQLEARNGGDAGTGPPRYLTQSAGPSSRVSTDEPRDSSSGAGSEGHGIELLEESTNTAGVDAAERSPAGTSLPGSITGSGKHGAKESLGAASRVSSFALSEDLIAPSSGTAGDGAPHDSRKGSAVPSGEASAHSVEHYSVASVHTPAVMHNARPGLASATAGTAYQTPAVGDDELVGDHDFADEDPVQIRSVHVESSDDRAGMKADRSDSFGGVQVAPPVTAEAAAPTASAPALRETSQRPGNSVSSDAAEQEHSPVASWTPQSDEHAPAAEEYSGGDTGEAGDFALSDDELLDEVEVARVLEEEDAREAAGDDLEDEEDEELQNMEGQVAMLAESSLEDNAGVSISPSAHGMQANEPTAPEPQEDASKAGQFGEEGLVHAGSNIRDNSGISEAGSGVRQAPHSAPFSPSTGTPASEIGSGTDHAAAAGGRVSDRLPDLGSMSAGSSQRIGADSRGSKAATPVVPSQASGGSAHGSSGSELASVQLHHSENHLDIENQPGVGAGTDIDRDEIALRTSMERLALSGLAPLGRQQAGSTGGSSGLTRATVAPVSLAPQQQPSGPGRTRPALAPLQPSATSAAEGGGALQPPDSPGKPPSLANYQGPTRQLWRPASAQQPQDPLLSSSETLIASTSSGPNLNPRSRNPLEAQCRTRMGAPVSGLATMARRMQGLGLADSIESSLDVSTSVDSVPAASTSLAGFSLPRQLIRAPAAMAAEAKAPLSYYDQEAGGSPGIESGSGSEDDGLAPGGLQQATATMMGNTGGSLSGRENSRRDGALFRLRQYGARRRKLLQQIGVKDPLLMSNATSLSTDSSTISDSEDGDGGPPLPRGSLPAAMRRM